MDPDFERPRARGETHRWGSNDGSEVGASHAGRRARSDHCCNVQSVAADQDLARSKLDKSSIGISDRGIGPFRFPCSTPLDILDHIGSVVGMGQHATQDDR